MKFEKQMNEQEQATEEKILEAASEVFTEKVCRNQNQRYCRKSGNKSGASQLLFPK
ncbi:hypothetical protein [Cloacibacterium normanense]